MNESRLSNLGNTCYQNAVLHPLMHSPGGFIEYILSGEYLTFLKKNKSDEEIYKTLVFQFHRILNAIFKSKEAELSINTWKELVGKKNDTFAGYSQQDAQEFLSFVIDKMCEEVGCKMKFVATLYVDNSDWSRRKKLLNLKADHSWERFNRRFYSLMVPMFSGQYRTKLEYLDSGALSNTFVPFNTLQVPILTDKNTTLDNCLMNIGKEEEMDKDNLVTSDLCYGKTHAKKTESIWKLPKYMIINLKRFNYNQFHQISTKNTAYVNYPLEIDMSKYIDDDSKYKSLNNNYYLYGVTLHLGIMFGAMSGGHYISYVRNRTDKKWYIYNDDHKLVELKARNLVNKNAYLLFYCRKD